MKIGGKNNDMAEVGALNIDLALSSAKFREGLREANAKLNEFEKSAKKIAKQIDGVGKSMQKVGKSMTTNLSLPIAAAAAAIGLTMKKTAEYADQIDKMSIRTGVSREQLQELKYAASQAGVSFENIQSTIIRTNKSMGDAATGLKTAGDAFKSLGVNVKDSDGKLRASSSVYMELIDKLSRVENEAERNFIGIQIMGKGYQEIIPFIAEGKVGLENYAKAARDAGLVMTDEGIKTAVEYADAMDKLKSEFEAAGQQIGLAFMPILKDVLIPFLENKVIPSIRSVGEWFKELSTTQKSWGIGIAAVVAAVGPLLMVFGAMARGLSSLIVLFPKIIAGIKSVGLAITGMTLPIAVAIAALAALTLALTWQPSPNIGILRDEYKAQTEVVKTLQAEHDKLTQSVDKSNAAQQGTFNTLQDLKNAHEAGAIVITESDVKLLELTKTLEAAKAKLEGIKTAVEESGSSLEEYNSTTLTAKDVLENLEVGLTTTEAKFASYNGVMGMTAEEIKNLRSHVGLLGGEFNSVGIKVGDFAQKMEAIAVEISIRGEQALSDYNASLQNLSVAANTFSYGPLTVLQQKYDLARQAVDGMIASNLDTGPSFTAMVASMEEAGVALDDFKAKNFEVSVDVGALWAETIDSMTTGIANFANETGNIGQIFDNLLLAIVDWGINVSKAMIAAAVASQAFQKLVFANPGAAIAAGIALGVALKIVKTSLQAPMDTSNVVPQMAQGGLVFGETLALVGEGRGTTSSNPEVIAPLDKLLSFMNPGESGGSQQTEFILRGETLVATLERNRKFSKYGSGK